MCIFTCTVILLLWFLGLHWCHWWCWSSVRDLRSTICFIANRRSSSSTLMASFMHYIWLRLNHSFISQKWPVAMWFSMGRLLGFTSLGMSAVNKFLGSEMLYTRSIATMSRLLEIFRQQWEMSIYLMEQQLPSPMIRFLMLLLLKPLLLLMVMVSLVAPRMCWSSHLLSCCLDCGWRWAILGTIAASLRPVMTRTRGWMSCCCVLLICVLHFCCLSPICCSSTAAYWLGSWCWYLALLHW